MQKKNLRKILVPPSLTLNKFWSPPTNRRPPLPVKNDSSLNARRTFIKSLYINCKSQINQCPYLIPPYWIICTVHFISVKKKKIEVQISFLPYDTAYKIFFETLSEKMLKCWGSGCYLLQMEKDHSEKTQNTLDNTLGNRNSNISNIFFRKKNWSYPLRHTTLKREYFDLLKLYNMSAY